jgi:hypothetical protein
MRRKGWKAIIVLLTFALIASSCGSEGETAAEDVTSEEARAASAETVQAADLRAGLTGLLTEHVYLAALSTGAALRGDTERFDAYATALNGPTDSNTSDLVDAITSVYGEDVGKAFDGLWRSEGHIPAFVAYTQAVAKNDAAGAQKAVSDLTAYAETVGETLSSVNENLDAAAIEAGVKHHVTTLKTVVDAQKAKDPAKTYSALRLAYKHMGDFAKTLADATAAKFPETVEGSATSQAAGVQATLTSLLREHVLLASSATGAALRGDTAAFGAAAAALNGPTNSNTASLVETIGSVYGGAVKDAFDGLWRSEGHIPAFVAYTQAVAKNDDAGKQKALTDLQAYAKTVGETLNSVNENLPVDGVTSAIEMHATTLTAVIDDQKAGDATKEATDLREAVHHMSDTAKVLADATVAKFPEKFAS